MALLYTVKINIKTHLFFLPVQTARGVAFTINVLRLVWGQLVEYLLNNRDIQSLLLCNILL